jgi:hypothetical protein
VVVGGGREVKVTVESKCKIALKFSCEWFESLTVCFTKRQKRDMIKEEERGREQEQEREREVRVT